MLGRGIRKAMKKFVVLEQGCEANLSISEEHKNQFSTEFCDSFRLNWKGDRTDRFADFFASEISWSEGRSHLFEQTRGKYEYYIFIDDDIDIASNTEINVAEQIRESLDRFKPIHGSIPSTSWPRLIGKYATEVIGMRGGDLCVQVFSTQYAELMYPAWWCGSGQSMWYAQFLAYRLAPERSLFLNRLRAVNRRHASHQDRDLEQFAKGQEISEAFRSALRSDKDKETFNQWSRSPLNLNLDCYEDVNERELQVTQADIAKFIDFDLLPKIASANKR